MVVPSRRQGRGMGSIFNIVGCSVALLCHFAGNPTAHPKYRGLHRLLLNSLRRGMPRAVALRDLRPNGGHCYTFTVDDDLPDDSNASSTIVLFEDGKSLPRWHCRTGKTIATEGRGTYMHIGSTIYFATSDNSSPLTNGRKYTAMHTLTSDPAVFVHLMKWQKATNATGAARLFEMLRILWPGHFSYAALSGAGPDATLSDVHFAIDQEAQMRLAARSLSTRPVAGTAGQWDVEITALAPVESPGEPWSLRARVDLSPTAETLLLSLGIDGPGGLFLSLDHTTPGTFAAKFGKLGAIRAMLLANFGDMAALERWTGTMARLATAPLSDGGFGLALDQQGMDALAHILSDSAIAHVHELTVHTTTGERRAALKQVAHGD
jgi:hypothetical protein